MQMHTPWKLVISTGMSLFWRRVQNNTFLFDERSDCHDLRAKWSFEKNVAQKNWFNFFGVNLLLASHLHAVASAFVMCFWQQLSRFALQCMMLLSDPCSVLLSCFPVLWHSSWHAPSVDQGMICHRGFCQNWICWSPVSCPGCNHHHCKLRIQTLFNPHSGEQTKIQLDKWLTLFGFHSRGIAPIPTNQWLSNLVCVGWKNLW